MFKSIYFRVVLGFFLISFSLSSENEHSNWRVRSLANCLKMEVGRKTKVSSNDVLRFIHDHHYMIVPQSNPPQQIPPMMKAPSRNRRNVGASGKQGTLRCPYKFYVIDYKAETVPRHLTAAKCEGCSIHCRPVFYTHKLLFKKCQDYWMWTQKTLPVAFVWDLDD